MLNDIRNNKDNVSYVLVFKLSRFGRNTADVLSSFQKMQMLSAEKMYKYLLNFDKLYDKFNDEEKKQFLASFVKEVRLYEEQQESG